MHSLKRSRHSYPRRAAAGAVLLAAAVTVGAEEGSATDWQYGLAIYGWFPNISGQLNYAPPGSSDDINVNVDQILDSLKMTFQGSFEARKGPWSLFTDIIYMDVGDSGSKSVSLPDGSSRILVDGSLDLKSWIWTLGGSYSVWRDGKAHLDLLAGARLLALDTDVKLTGGGPHQRYRSLSTSDNFWDLVIGVKGRVALDDRWYLPYYADVGTGDTDLTWQVMAGVGYGFDWGDVQLAYRYLEYDQGSDDLVQDLGFGGPMLGVVISF